MPQMAPSNWLILFILFNMIMIMYISTNYFLNNPSFTPTSSSLKNKSFLWKW